MAGIVFTHRPTVRSTRLDRRRLLLGMGATVLSGSIAASRTGLVAAQTPGATPIASSDLTPVARLLRLISSRQAIGAANSGVLFYYADLATQFAQLGIKQGGQGGDDLDSNNLVSALAPLATASQAFQYAMVPGFVETFGFQPVNVHRALYFGTPPYDVSIFQGGIDRDVLVAAWKGTGYKEKTFADGTTFWTVGEDGELDLSSPVGQYGVGAFNNAVLIDDDTVVFSRYASMIEEIAKQASGDSMSLLEQPGVAETLTAFSEDVVSVIAVTPSFVRSAQGGVVLGEETDQVSKIEEKLDGTKDDGGQLPRYDVAAFGIRAGAVAVGIPDDGTPAATPEATPVTGVSLAEARLHAGSPQDAQQIADIVAWRWEHLDSALSGTPYQDLMTITQVGVSEKEPTVAAIDFDAGPSGGLWTRLVLTRDLLPFLP